MKINRFKTNILQPTFFTLIFWVNLCKVKLVTVVKGNLKAPFTIATTPRCRGRVLLSLLNSFHVALEVNVYFFTLFQWGLNSSLE